MQDDLFGHIPQPRDSRAAATPASAISKPIQHTPDTIRALMVRLIGELRAADEMPWTERDLHGHVAMFPYMAEWLPEEGERLHAEFRQEVSRLTADKRSQA